MEALIGSVQVMVTKELEEWQNRTLESLEDLLRIATLLVAGMDPVLLFHSFAKPAMQ